MANQNMIINIGGEVSGGIVQKYQGEGLGNREKAEVKRRKKMKQTYMMLEYPMQANSRIT